MKEKMANLINTTRFKAAAFMGMMYATVGAPMLVRADYKDTVNNLLVQLVDIIGFIFRTVGIVLSVYAIGSLIMAFKNDDADSKQRASTLLVVGVVLIAMPSIINWIWPTLTA